MDLNSQRTTPLCGSPEPIDVLSFSPDNRYLLTARFHHRLDEGFRHDRIWEYQLWDATVGVPLGSAQVDGEPRALTWAPDSSMFLAIQLERVYRVNIGPTGDLRATPQPSKGFHRQGEGIVFSADHRLFLTYGGISSRTSVSLWDYEGNEMWSSEPADWAAFANHGSQVVIAQSPGLTPGKILHYQFEIFDLGAKGGPVGPPRVVPASQFDYRILTGAQLPDLQFTLGASLRAENPSLIVEYGCAYLIANFDVGLVLCAQDKVAPILFDVSTRKPKGVLTAWSFGNVEGVPVFSPDGKMLLVASRAGPLTAWDTTTRDLRWKRAAYSSNYQFSADGKRILLSTSDKCDTAIDTQTGNIIGTIPMRPSCSLVWVNPTATRLMTNEAAHGGDLLDKSAVLVLWDVDHSIELQRIELSSEDRAEEDRDIAALKATPSVPILLEIAHRRLRACNGALTSSP
jgi:WD40 repeat protein